MKTSIALLLAALSFPGAAAQAGTLGDFTDSIRDDDDRGDSSSSSDDDDDSDDSGSGGGWSSSDDHDYDDDSDGEEILIYIMARVLAGYCPGAMFSYGLGPYDGRGYVYGARSMAAGTFADGVVTELAPTEPSRHGMLSMRVDAVGLTDLSAVGASISSRLESSYTPAIGVHYWSMGDPVEGDRLHKFGVALEPRLWMDRNIAMGWGLGYVHYGNQEGRVNSGALLAAYMELFPARPWLVQSRLQFDIMSEAVVVDFYAGVGVNVSGPWSFLVGYRRFGSERGETLSMITSGIAMQSGF